MYLCACLGLGYSNKNCLLHNCKFDKTLPISPKYVELGGHDFYVLEIDIKQIVKIFMMALLYIFGGM